MTDKRHSHNEQRAATRGDQDGKKARFLEALEDCGHVKNSATIVALNTGTLYRWRKEDPAFAEAWDEATKIASMHLEDEARRRAFGYDEQLHYQGHLTGDVVRKYSDTLLIFLLKGNNPEKFKDRVSTDNKHDIEGGIQATVVYQTNGREVPRDDD